MWIRVALVLSVVLIGASPASAQRLPDTVQPQHYRLQLIPDIGAARFRGHVTIDVELRTATDVVTLNAAELQLGNASITSAGRTQTARVTLDASSETAALHVDQPVMAGPARLELDFTGVLNTALRGFYLSKGNGRSYAVTQFEATDARRAFPSFDEPAYKATFDISAVIDHGDVAISNGRVIADAPGPDAGKHTVTFATTARLSTYLIALVVGDFQCRTGSSDGTVIRVCTTPDKVARTAFALEAAQQQLAFYNRYFGIKYPFGKLDLIGIPDFAAGAMENAGAITFRERLLLVDPAGSSQNAKKGVADVLAHEIAHQWFGNLVTMKWWDDIWLNEGFASWMEHKPLAAWRPAWHIEEDEARETRAALELDTLRSTRPIRTQASTPAEINELFDGIAYDKTAAVLRMVEAYVGADAFRDGVQAYLRKHAYGNATGEDFWSEMTRATGKPVDAIMRSFVDQPGAPLLSARGACHDRDRTLTLQQERFERTPAFSTSSPSWTLPVCLRAPDGKARCTVLDRPAASIAVDSCAPILNAGERGYYFSEYAPEALRMLRQNLATLRPVERIGLAGDEWWMVRTGRHDIGEYLGLTGAMAALPSGAGVEALAERLTTIANDIASVADRPRFEAWVRSRFSPALERLGIPGKATDSEELQGERAALLSLVGDIGNDPGVQTRVRALVDAYLANAAPLPPTLVEPALQIAALGGGVDLYDRYLAQLTKLNGQPEEYYRMLSALSWFRDPALIARTLDLAIASSTRSQDTGGILAAVLHRPWGREPAWSFVRAHWSELSQRLGNFGGVGTIVDALGSFCQTPRATDVRQFFTDHPVATVSRTVEQTIERIQSCAAFRERQSPALSRWLAAAN
jgi:aminopeptidase N